MSEHLWTLCLSVLIHQPQFTNHNHTMLSQTQTNHAMVWFNVGTQLCSGYKHELVLSSIFCFPVTPVFFHLPREWKMKKRNCSIWTLIDWLILSWTNGSSIKFNCKVEKRCKGKDNFSKSQISKDFKLKEDNLLFHLNIEWQSHRGQIC